MQLLPGQPGLISALLGWHVVWKFFLLLLHNSFLLVTSYEFAFNIWHCRWFAIFLLLVSHRYAVKLVFSLFNYIEVIGRLFGDWIKKTLNGESPWKSLVQSINIVYVGMFVYKSQAIFPLLVFSRVKFE